MERRKNQRYPRLIIKTRYGGVYEGGQWAAFPCDSENLPSEVTGSDLECRAWFRNPTIAVGVGRTPDEALAALESVVDACEHPVELQCAVPGGSVCGFCDQPWGNPISS